MDTKTCLPLCIVLVACSACAVDCSATNQAARDGEKSRLVQNASLTNIVRVGSFVLKTLERSIDEKCAIFIVSLRFIHQRTDTEEFCRTHLISACLSESSFKEEITKSLTMLWHLDANATDAQLQHAVLTFVSLDEDSARDDYYRLVAPMGCPPTSVFRRDKDDDYMRYMTEDEKYRYLLLYSYFKSKLLRSFSASFETVRPKSTLSEMKRAVNRSLSEASGSYAPSVEEIKFVLSIVVDK